MIHVSGLTKRFFPRASLFFQSRPVTACEGIHLDIGQGQAVGIVGPNGSGKTTLLRIIAGVILPDEGQVAVNGFNVATEDAKAKRSVSFATSESRNFYIRLTGRENLKFFAALYGLSAAQAKRRIEELTEFFKLGDYLGKMFQEYSSGIKQRLVLARSFLLDTPVVLLDEPTKNLDDTMAQRTRDLIKNDFVGKMKKTVLIASHNFSEITDVADKVAVIDGGRIKAFGTLNELKSATNRSNWEDIYRYYVTS